jgi:hypothetical protein
MNGTAIANRLHNSFKITCTDHRIIEILGLRPSNRLPVSYYRLVYTLIAGGTVLCWYYLLVQQKSRFVWV